MRGLLLLFFFFLGGGGLTFAGKFAFQNRLGWLIDGSKFTVFALFYLRTIFQVQAFGELIFRGAIQRRVLCVTGLGGLHLEGLIFGILRQLPGVLEIKTTTTNADSFFRLNFNVYINVDNRERARARDKNPRRPISLEEKQKKIIAAVRKRGNISRQQGVNERQRKKK